MTPSWKVIFGKRIPVISVHGCTEPWNETSRPPLFLQSFPGFSR